MWKAFSMSNWILQIQLIEHGLKHYSRFLQHSLGSCWRGFLYATVKSGCIFYLKLIEMMTTTILDSLFPPFQFMIFEFRHQSGYRIKRLRIFTCAVRIMALSAFCPVTATLRSPMGGRWALPGPLLSAIGTGHRAIAPRAPLLPLSVHWGTNHNPTSMSHVKGKKEGRQKWEEIFRSLYSLSDWKPKKKKKTKWHDYL